MDIVFIKEGLIESIEPVLGEYWECLESFLDKHNYHVEYGTIVLLNGREIKSKRTYGDEEGRVILYGVLRKRMEVGMEVEVINKITRVKRPKIEVRW